MKVRSSRSYVSGPRAYPSFLIQELKDKYFAELNASKTDRSDTAKPAAVETEAPKEPAAKAKPKLKKKAANDDPFASDDDGDDAKEVAPPKKKVSAKRAASSTKRSKPESDVEDEDEDVKPKKKRAVKK